MPEPKPDFEELQASEIFCGRCRQPQPVRSHLLLVLPDGRKYEYRCAVCGNSVGSRTDHDPQAFREVLAVADAKPASKPRPRGRRRG